MGDELERLKRRRLLELQRRLTKKREPKQEKPKEPSSEELLDQYFYGRAWEIYNTAKAQFPKVMPQIEMALIEAVKEGRIKQRIDGESLYHFLRQLGLQIRLRTTIRYKEHGELKTLEQKIRENS